MHCMQPAADGKGAAVNAAGLTDVKRRQTGKVCRRFLRALQRNIIRFPRELQEAC